MKLETPMIALLVVGLLFTGLFTVFITDLGRQYGAEYNLSTFKTNDGDTSLQEAFDRINESKAQVDDMSDSFEAQEVTDSGSLFGFLKMTWQIGKQTLGSVNIMKTLLYSTSSMLGIPPMFVNVAVVVVVLIFIITIVMVLAGRTYG